MSAKAACRGREWLISACMVGAKLVRLWRNSDVARWANAVALQDSDTLGSNETVGDRQFPARKSYSTFFRICTISSQSSGPSHVSGRVGTHAVGVETALPTCTAIIAQEELLDRSFQ
jgi:hypothetical protein